MGKIRILHTIRQGLIGGGETHVLDLVRHLNREQFESTVLSFTDGPMIDRLNEMGIETKVIPTTKPFDFRVWKAIRLFIAEKRFDLIHAHGTRAASNLLRPARIMRIPIIYTVHGWSFHDDQSPLVKRIRVKSEKYISDRTTLNISVSQSNQDTGKRYFGRYTSTVINNGIDLNKFDPAAPHTDLRESLGIASDKILAGCIMRMTRQKDPINMVKAFAKAVKEDPRLHLLMVGDGELKEEAIALAKNLNAENNITFEKFRTDIPDVLHTLDVYCLPSLWEGLPIGLLEAMGMGKAVIATHVDGSREIVKNNENGLLIAPEAEEELAKALLTLSRDEAFRKKLSGEAARTVAERYDVVKMTQQIEKVYTNLLIA